MDGFNVSFCQFDLIVVKTLMSRTHGTTKNTNILHVQIIQILQLSAFCNVTEVLPFCSLIGRVIVIQLK